MVLNGFIRIGEALEKIGTHKFDSKNIIFLSVFVRQKRIILTSNDTRRGFEIFS